jgi:hypothetical protein
MARSRRPAGSAPLRAGGTRQRDYAAEYRRRVASAARKIGKAPGRLTAAERREARGHKAEAAEKKTRRERIKREYGVTPERLARLRREARDHIAASLESSRTRGPVNTETIRKSVAAIGREGLELLIEMDGGQIFAMAGMSYADLIETYPELENPDERNPGWYHPG